MNGSISTPRRVIVRDLIIFQVKILLDGLKDLVLWQISLVAAIIDILVGGRSRGRIFYGMMRGCERFDLWLNLYSAADHAKRTDGGLLQERVRGADSLLSFIQKLLAGVWSAACIAWRRRSVPRSA